MTNSRKTKILITGGAGFIGSHIADSFIKKDYDVVIVDDLSTGYEENIHKDARFYKVDIQDNVALSAVFEKEKPDFVCHEAAQKDVRLSVAEPAFDAGINILGSINILQNCMRHEVRKVVFASTGGAIYGEQDAFPAPETHPARPISPYGITKLVAEHYLYYYKVVYGLNYVSLRYSNVYGPRQDPRGEAGVVAIFIKKMLNGEEPMINGDGEQTRDFVYVEDVAEANVLSVESEVSGDIFNIGTGIETNVNEIAQQIKKVINPNIAIKHGPHKPGEQKRSVIDCKKAKKILGWEPCVALSDGLRKTCDYFSGNSVI